MKHPFEYVRFRLNDPRTVKERFAALDAIVRALRRRKAQEPSGQLADDAIESAANEIALLVPPEAKSTFAAAPLPGAWLPSAGLTVLGYDLDATICAILGCEYQLGDVVQLDQDLGEVRFLASAWPFGGVTSLIRLVEAFGFDLVEADNGTDLLTRDDYLGS